MKVLIMLYFLILSPITKAYIKSEEGMIPEFSFLLESLQDYPMGAEEIKNLETRIKSLDTHLQYLSTSEMNFLLKSEIYKGILHHDHGNEEFKLETAEKLIKDLGLKQNVQSIPFHRWLTESFRLDLLILTKDKKFQNLLNFKKSKSAISNLQDKSHFKKVQLVMGWGNFLNSSSDEELSTHLKPLLLQILATLDQRAELFAKLTKFNYSASNKLPLKFFNIQDLKSAAPKKDMNADIIETLELPDEKEESVKSDWKPGEDSLKLKAPSPDPNYTPPAVLPAAKNNWDN